MALTLPADAGEPMSAVLIAGAEVKRHEKCEFPIETPVEGVVSWLRPCGDTIEADDVVATLDT